MISNVKCNTNENVSPKTFLIKIDQKFRQWNKEKIKQQQCGQAFKIVKHENVKW